MLEKNPLISVIVPIYNVEKYLEKCIQSIINQTYQNLDIILVDDGSTDNGGIICDKFVNIDNRIRVIHKKNGGLTTARKIGVYNALGSYIGFVDGDDWIDCDMYEEMLAKGLENNAEIVLTDMYREKFSGEQTVWSGAFLDEGSYNLDTYGELIASKLIPGLSLEKSGINGGVHVKLFESSLLKKCIKNVPDEIHGFADDKVIVYKAILSAKKIYVYHKAFYHGVDRNSSATHVPQTNFFMQMQFVYDYLINYFETTKYKDILIKQLYQFAMLSCIYNINKLAGYDVLPSFFLSNISQIQGKRILLYGSGKVGRCFYNQITSGKICDIVLWVDKYNYDVKKDIYPITHILNIDYDYLLIAVGDEILFSRIKNDLLSYGIDSAKIIWQKPVNMIEYFSM